MPGIHGKNPDKAVVSLNRSSLFMCLANDIHLFLFQWKPIDINLCSSIRCDSPSLGHKETDRSNSFWMWRPSDFMMSRLKAVLSHLVFKLHRPVARRSTCLRSVSASAQETWTHAVMRQTAPRPPGTWPHGNPLSITCAVCLVPVSVPLTADLLQGRGAEWVVCQGSEWLIYSRLWSEGVEPTQTAPHGLGLGPGLLLLLLLLHLLRES